MEYLTLDCGTRINWMHVLSVSAVKKPPTSKLRTPPKRGDAMSIVTMYPKYHMKPHEYEDKVEVFQTILDRKYERELESYERNKLSRVEGPAYYEITTTSSQTYRTSTDPLDTL